MLNKNPACVGSAAGSIGSVGLGYLWLAPRTTFRSLRLYGTRLDCLIDNETPREPEASGTMAGNGKVAMALAIRSP